MLPSGNTCFLYWAGSKAGHSRALPGMQALTIASHWAKFHMPFCSQRLSSLDYFLLQTIMEDSLMWEKPELWDTTWLCFGWLWLPSSTFRHEREAAWREARRAWTYPRQRGAAGWEGLMSKQEGAGRREENTCCGSPEENF